MFAEQPVEYSFQLHIKLQISIKNITVEFVVSVPHYLPDASTTQVSII